MLSTVRVVTSTVMSSSLRQLATLGRRGRTWAAWRLSKCGACGFSTFSKFHMTASALKSLPSWNFTPGRSLKDHLVRSTGLAAHSVARPGTSLPGRLATSISHATSGS